MPAMGGLEFVRTLLSNNVTSRQAAIDASFLKP